MDICPYWWTIVQRKEQDGLAGFSLSKYYLNFNIDSKNVDDVHHSSQFCLIFILQGAGALGIGEATFPLQTGDCFLIPFNVHHSYRAAQNTEWKYMWINFDGPIFREIMPQTAFCAKSPLCHCDQRQRQLFEQLLALKKDYRGGGYYLALSTLIEIVASFTESSSVDVPAPNYNSIETITSFIKNNLHRTDLNVGLLVKETGLSRATLYNIFQKAGYLSISRYISGCRIAKAKHLLRSTALPVSQVAYAVGFQDPHFFSRVFKKIVTRTPTEYRSLMTK